MGLLQRALETYDNIESLVGVYMENMKSPLAPIGHIITKMQIEITINANGEFIKAEKKDDEIIIIPATEESAGRTSGDRAHPLCDKLEYISNLNAKKHILFVELLQKWHESDYSHPMVDAIYSYILKDTVIKDLEREKCIIRDDKGEITNQDLFIGWNVIGFGSSSGAVWKNRELMERYQLFYNRCLNNGAIIDVCFLTGKTDQLAKQHLGGVVSNYGKAKIISASDEKYNYTYRGKFETPEEALTVSYTSSQKAHNALKWIISNDSRRFGDRTFVCWNPFKKEIPQPYSPLLVRENDNNKLTEPGKYGDVLRNILNGFKSENNIKKLQKSDAIVFAGFAAATTGRLSITYYSELQAEDYLERLLKWDSTCCWPYQNFGLQSPSLDQIALMAFGTRREKEKKIKIEIDPKIMGEQMQHLFSCRVNGALFPIIIMLSMRHKADNLQAFTRNNPENLLLREKLLFTICAVIKKYRYDHWKEDWKMALEENKKDRSYQFGRLLAVMEKIEDDYYKYSSTESRETNAIRMQQKFVQRPFYTAEKVMQKLKAAYLPRLSMGTRIYYDALIGGIMEQLSEFYDDRNKPLSETYLLGYYLQKNALYTKKQAENNGEAGTASEDIE